MRKLAKFSSVFMLFKKFLLAYIVFLIFKMHNTFELSRSEWLNNILIKANTSTAFSYVSLNTNVCESLLGIC